MRGIGFVKRQVKKHFWRRGLEIRSSPHLGKFLESRKIGVVLDVGANIGQFGRELRDQGYRGLIVSFEPVKSVFETLKNVADSDGAWEAHNFALGPAPGRMPIKVAKAPSSVRCLSRRRKRSVSTDLRKFYMKRSWKCKDLTISFHDSKGVVCF